MLALIANRHRRRHQKCLCNLGAIQKARGRECVDYFGPIYGQMFLVVIDAHTKWIEVYPTTTSTSANTISKLRTASTAFGLPDTVVSDNGPAFASSEFKWFLYSNGIQHITSAPYHHASNGLAERAIPQ